jgi:hypothetical protein
VFAQGSEAVRRARELTAARSLSEPTKAQDVSGMEPRAHMSYRLQGTQFQPQPSNLRVSFLQLLLLLLAVGFALKA